MNILFIVLQILAQLMPFIIQILKQYYGGSQLKANEVASNLYLTALKFQGAIDEFLAMHNVAKNQNEDIQDWVTRIMKG